MRKGILASLLAGALVLALALVGCGGGTNAKAAFVGTWDLTEMEEDGEITGSDDIELMRSLGLDVYLQLDEDGVSKLVLFGEDMAGTWSASSATAGSITLGDQTVDMTITDGTLSMQQDDATLRFVKGEARTDDETDTDEAEAEEPITFDEPITLADDDTCTIVATGKQDYYGDPAIMLTVTNKTDEAIYLTTGDFTVKGAEADGIISETIDANDSNDAVELWFEASELGSASLEELTDVKGTIEVSNDETLETISTYEVEIA